MEMFPNIRRFSKRSLLCLYFACATFLACAFYTFYTESYTPFSATYIHSTLTGNFINSADDKLIAKRLGSQVSLDEGAVILPAVSFTSSSSLKIPTHKSDNNTILNHTSISVSGSSSKTMQLDTKYVYLTNSPSGDGGTIKSSSALPKRTTQPTLPPDTCQMFTMKDTKLILLWTPFFEQWGYITDDKFRECGRCRNCRVTNDRTKLKESDAIVFHARDMSLSDLPPIRYPHQRWIFYCLESPPYSDFPGMEYMVNMFNWTMTYRSDSDIVTQYGAVAKIHPSRKLDLQSMQLSFNNKTKSVVWMSSHCPTHGGRDDYVDELRKFIDVDVYGTCGTSVCPPNGTKKCLRQFASKYKFFLAFENTICKDYVTEKFFRNLEYNMIPVVFGGASYSKVAPPGSYIDALSFKSPRHLAFFLTGISKDFKLWSTYFRWKQDYVVDMRNKRECDLCSLLHRRDSKPTSYADFRKWWVSDAKCRTWKPK